MLRRALISIAMIGFLAAADAAVHSQTVTDPSEKSSAATSSQPITPPPTLPDVPPLLPGRSAPGLLHYSAPTTSPGQFAPAPNPGPVTGYGPGGMAPVPGAPANPPYSYGPLR
jgi:hypothetical protein